MNGGSCLLLLFCFAAQPKLQHYSLHASLLIMFWGIVSIAWLIITVQTIELQHQAMAVIAIIYMLSYVISGIKTHLYSDQWFSGRDCGRFCCLLFCMLTLM